MFSNKIRGTVLGIIICFSISMLTAQKLEYSSALVDYKVLLLDGSKTYLPIYKVNRLVKPTPVVTVEHAAKKTEVSTVYTDDWSNTVFNTYRNKRSTGSFQLHFKDTVFSSPVTHKMVVTSRYGWRHGRPHRGIDIDLETGDYVKALLAGKVRYARRHGGHGKTIVIRHDNGLETVYAHLSEYWVKEDQRIEKGQIIGQGGVSGNARGSHLHLEVRYQGKSIHPEYLFEFTDETKIRSNTIVVTKKWMTPRLHKSTKKSKILIETSLEKPLADAIANIPTKSVYVVRKGDTLYGIARRHDIEVSEICKLNEIQHNSILNVGQEILIY